MTNTINVSATQEQLAEAIEKSQSATAEVKQVAEELAVVHSVLKTKLDEVSRAEGDVDAAVTRTGEAAEQLEKATEVLAEVNQSLAEQARQD